MTRRSSWCLRGVTIHNENGPAIYAKNEDKCFVTLADGSFRLVAGGNGIKSNKDTEATQGFVSFTGGRYSSMARRAMVMARLTTIARRPFRAVRCS